MDNVCPARMGDGCLDRMVAWACFGTIALLLVFPLMDFDLHWHLANGRAMVEQHRVISEEIFSYTREGVRFDNIQWLGQVVLYLVHSAAGDNGLILFKVALSLACCFFVYRAAMDYGSGRAIAAMLVLLAVIAGLHRFVARTELFSLFFMGLAMYLISGARAGRLRMGALYLLPAIMMIWNRSHLSVYGIILIASMLGSETFLFLIDRRAYAQREFLRRFWAAFIALIAVMAIDPYGFRAYLTAPGASSGPNMLMATVEEFAAPRLSEFHAFWAMLCAAALLPVVFCRNRKAMALMMVMLPFLALSLRYNRVIAFFALAAVPLIGCCASSMALRLKQWPFGGLIYSAAMGAALLAAIGYVAALKSGDGPYRLGLGVNEERLPVGAVRFLREAGVSGNIFNRGFYGGYLAYTMFPEKRIFMYNHHSVFDSLLVKTQDRAFLDEYGITHALVNHDDFWSRAVLEEGRWAPVYWHSNMAVYLRRGVPTNEALIGRYELYLLRPGTESRMMALLLSKGSPYLGQAVREGLQLLAYGRDDALADMVGRALKLPEAMGAFDARAIDRALAHNPGSRALREARASLSASSP